MDTITLTPQMLSDIIRTAVSQGIRDYEAGKAGEVSYRKGVQRYGQWFVDAVERGDIRGLRRGAKSNSKIVYQISDIEAQRAKEIAETSKIINYTK
jgi:hypothetical protein